ncbi:lysophospholipid acyltransferase family protein [Corynebacterium pygosceleis]|uniref:lysophospholipid acyltransferase family protein n=1 Tax=Corynebacterium pygosceleis TaxID=2800406 RepID=UPI001906C640|nr:lysophospholipid acyltransferase family protein [Corynebacterium pygosceleis]MCL0121608.1 1-acyl-sn-glycerol-3-phosphate acyltransferase [Corynebacterium pygosceleis]
MTQREFIREGIFRYPADLERVPDHPTEATEPFYSRIVAAVRALMGAQDITITIEGVEHVPTDGGALLAYNHTGYYDFIFGGVAGYFRGRRLVRFMAKREIYDVPVVGWFMNRMRHIRVDRSAGRGALDEAVRRLRAGELVGIFPEGTISRSFEMDRFKTGAARIADAADVPLIPIAMWGSQRIISKGVPRNLGRKHIPVWIRIGEPLSATGDPTEVTERLRSAVADLLDGVRADYAAEYGSFEGAPWMPASLGGSAPTLEEAAVITAEKKRARADRKAARAAHRADRRADVALEKITGHGRALPARLRRALTGLADLIRGRR